MTTKIMQAILVLLLCIGFTENSFGQTRNVTTGKRVSLSNFGEIIENKEIIGYYTFYAYDKVDKKNNAYILSILDANLNEIASEKLTLPKTYYLLEGSYNKENLLFAFYETKENKIALRRYSKKAKFLGQTFQELIKDEQLVLLSAIRKEEIMNTRIFGVPNLGFLHFSMKKSKKLGYEVDFISSDLKKNRNWTYRSSSVSKEIETASFLHYDSKNKLILLSAAKKPGRMSKKFETYIVGIDATTGRRKFETKLEDNNYKIQVFNGYNNEVTGTSKLVGSYFTKDGKLNDNSLGFCTFSFDAQGKIVDKKFVSWAKDVAKLLPVNKKGKMDQMGYLYIHNVIPTVDGRTFVIAEGYKKAVSAGGTAASILGAAAAASGSGSSNISAFKMVVNEMVVFEMDKDSNLKTAKIFEKDNTNIALPAGAAYVGAVTLGHYIKAIGDFDYSFTQVSKDKEGFIIGYQDYKRIKGEKNHWVFAAISNIDGEYSTDEIDLRTENASLRVYPGKPGYIMIVEVGEYTKKTKTRSVSMRLEKVNY
ncbi:MAG: DUF6770 family protein [Flammeovirgaceae bacterium]